MMLKNKNNFINAFRLRVLVLESRSLYTISQHSLFFKLQRDTPVRITSRLTIFYSRKLKREKGPRDDPEKRREGEAVN